MKQLFCFLILLPLPSWAIEVAFEKDDRLPLVYIDVAVKGGSILDPKSKSGLSNFMGDMLLRGTKKRSKSKVDLELDRLGASISSYTRGEMQVVEAAVLSNNLDPFLKLLTEVITQPRFSNREIKKQKKETLTSISDSLEDDETVAHDRFKEFMFKNHPYGIPTLGTIKSVRSFTQKEIRDHYNRLYVDQNLLVVGTGDADPIKIQAWANSLAKLRPGQPAGSDLPSPQAPNRRRIVILDKPDRTQTQILIGQLGPTMADPDFFPLYVANHAFGGTRQSTLSTEIRLKRGWSYGAHSYFRHGRKPNSWLFYLFPSNQYAPRAVRLTLDLIKTLKKTGISREAFSYAKESLVNSSGFRYDTPQKRVTNVLLENILQLPKGFMKNFGPRIKAVTLEDANRALKKFLQPDKLLVTVLGTANVLKEPLAKATGVSQKMIEVIDYKGTNSL